MAGSTPKPPLSWRKTSSTQIREVTDKPIKYILLSHYHAVRVFGASAYNACQEILASRDTYDLIVERGE